MGYGRMPLMLKIICGILIPFAGTTLGAAAVLFVRGQLDDGVQRPLIGFASGVMVAASIWSLLLPALEQSGEMGGLSFFPAVTGFWIGILFLMLLNYMIPYLRSEEGICREGRTDIGKKAMLLLAVTLHNIPEGMAVGVIFAGWLSGNAGIAFMEATACSIGIAIQNFPEGAIVSMPLRAGGMAKKKAFFYGTLSGAVEPAAALLTILAVRWIVPALPYLLSFAAGAMMYVVVEELIPEISEEPHSNRGVLLFAAGFTIMLALDVAFG